MRTPAIAIGIAVALLFMTGTGAAQEAWDVGSPRLMTDGLVVPVDFAFGGDGYVYVALLTPREIVRASVETGMLDDEFRVQIEQADWEIYTETGLFSIALHPEFHQNGVLYASYSQNESGEWRNVLSRITLLDASGTMEEEVLLTRPGGHWHNGGRVRVADGHLWWTTGDAVPFFEWRELARVAQEDGNLQGKVLRLTLDGDPAPGNPWGDHAYTKGHRNVFGIAWDGDNGRMLVTENGNAETDYLYLLEAGANYGWPDCEGPCQEPNPEYTDPIWNSEGTIAPTGATWYRDAFWFGAFNSGDIYRVSESADGWNVENVYHHASERPRVLHVEVAPDGSGLWYSSYEGLALLSFPEHEAYPLHEPLREGPYWWNGTERPGAGAFTLPGPGLALAIAATVAAASLMALAAPRWRR